ncbi:PAS domain S-box protein [Hoeflea poritis]|uniref:histidine kinase n=1 Tax=Hoeflea poritis TaxID=2993659 RepID=A0ABT4VS96_9HYPH|nr:PAS domain S-box protein [Hoeflea poritis]MDA4847587.1 PAS domain S-box protein [Hoeflea poritis]
MPTGRYPFIDIAVHDKVRARFASGEAVAVLSNTLDAIFWVNGAGARLFGHDSLYECMDEGLKPTTVAFRQIEAAARAVRSRPSDAPHAFVMRAGAGFRRPLLSASMEQIALPDGQAALLLTVAEGETATVPGEMAANILDGFEEMDTHAAVLDDSGAVLEATHSFGRLQLGSEVRREIVSDVTRDNERLVKHPIPTALGQLPAAVARICDDPALFLLFAVELPAGETMPAAATPSAEDRQTGGDARRARPAPKPDAVPSVLNLAPERTAEKQQQDADRNAPAPVEGTTGSGEDKPAKPKVRESASDKPAEPGLEDHVAFVFDPDKRPTRFVWKIDAQGCFNEISREFADTVGPNAADVEGRKFADVAQVFNIDPDHTIADLLRKRDTWSGKTVMWPVQGTDLRVPVDLAALPTYSREREFDGFRGFGIVRPADSVSDPERIGMALAGESRLKLDAPENQDDTEDTIATDILAGPGEDEARADPPLSDPDDAETGAAPDEEDASTETPALEISDTPGRRHTDKIIRLEERRQRSRDGLSNTEKQALREIAEQLGGEGADDEAQPAQPFGKRQTRPDEPQSNDNDLTGAQEADTEEQLPDVFEPEARQQPAETPASDQRDKTVSPVVLEQLPVPVIVHDGTRIFYINEEFRQLTGYLTKTELNEAGGMTALFDDGSGGAGDETVSTGGNLVLRTYDGERISVRAKLRSIGWDDGRALMLALQPMSGMHPTADAADAADEADAADFEQADDQLSALQVEVDELRSILETATDGVVLIGEDGIIRSMNKSACALFDYDETESSGRPFAMLFAHESQRAVQDYLSGLTGNGVASVLNDGREVIGREASGGFLPLFMTIGHLSGSNGYCAVMRDITQWKRAEEELRSAKREAETASSHKSEFLARVSHEIRTPLNAIIGFADLMAEERFGPIGSPRYVEYANDIRRSGKHVLDIVNDLLDISKIEAGEQELDFGAVSLNDALLETISILQPQANGQRVIVRTSLSSSVPEVVADRRSIKQIAINILSNAIRFTPAGGQIVVSTTYEPSGNVSLRIRDTGVGMTRFQLEQAMKPFKQVAGFNRQRGEGTGLGLPLAKAMAEANRAQFAMNSQPGQGTLVEIIFPSQRVLAE